MTVPAEAPATAPDATPSTEATSTSANSPPSGKPRKASIYQRKNRHLTALGSSLTVTIAPRHVFRFG